MQRAAEDWDRELEWLKKAVDWLEDRRKHDARTIYKLELEDKKRQNSVWGLQNEVSCLYDHHHGVESELHVA